MLKNKAKDIVYLNATTVMNKEQIDAVEKELLERQVLSM